LVGDFVFRNGDCHRYGAARAHQPIFKEAAGGRVLVGVDDDRKEDRQERSTRRGQKPKEGVLNSKATTGRGAESDRLRVDTLLFGGE
jgi:hypothetical protein